MSIEDRLAALRKNIETAKLDRAKIQRDKELAEKSKVEHLKRLKDDYGVDSLVDAREVLGLLETQLEEALTSAEKKLKECQSDI